MKYEAVLFDLDGTLLDTLIDLTNSVNYALEKMGYPKREKEEVRRFLGNGIKRLMELSCPEDIEEEAFERTFNLFKEHYDKHSQDNTKPYDGVLELMRKLSVQGVKLAIVSNKVDSAVAKLHERFFSEYVDVAIGDRPGLNRKPEPDSCLLAMKELGVSKENTVYIGDSEVDIATAANAGLDCITVLWGFRDRDFLEEKGAANIVSAPDEIYKEVCG